MLKEDKILHFIGGILIAFFIGLIHPVLGFIAALVAGWAKEEWDKKHGTYDLKDMYATWIGGVVGTIIVFQG